MDWGAWVAKVTKQQILKIIKIIESSYAEDETTKALIFCPHEYAQTQELRQFVDSLDDHTTYALMACEL